MTDTDFLILDIGNLAASARGIRQELEPVANGRMRTKLSGRTYSSARPQFNKFNVKVMGEDIWPPAFGGLWIGATVTIHSSQDLPQPQRVGEVPIRPVVPGSLIYLDAENNIVEPADTAAKFFTFRPVLTVKVVNWNIAHDEWGAIASWDIEFIEETA
jgi:hypothetical protein